MEKQELGWFAWAPGTGEAFPAALPRSAGPERGDRPELADVARLGRRALRGVLRAARSDLGPTLRGALLDHLGVLATDVAVVEESWPAYDHVNVQAGLEAWLAEPGRDHEVVGVTGFQHREFGLAELLDGRTAGAVGAPARATWPRVNLAAGPDGAGAPLRAPAPSTWSPRASGARPCCCAARTGAACSEGVSLQVVSTEPGVRPRAAAVEVRRLALAHNVFRGQVLSFGGEMFGPGPDLMQFPPPPVAGPLGAGPPRRSARVDRAPGGRRRRATGPGCSPAVSTSSGACCCTARPAPARRTRCATCWAARRDVPSSSSPV